ncbi:MAG TPA: long-chain fatty acid--CoA ligase [Myxococcota bacterium]|nr:long-chain fatty acid--CoA ligase [Myxococcota bacterium]
MKATSNWLEMHTRFRPDAPALVDAGTGRAWTYRELWRESLGWAGRLRAEGVRPGDRVAVLAHNRGETLAILFACAELGAILLPLNWRLTAPELTWQLDHCGARVVLVDAAHAQALDRPTLSLEEGPHDPVGDLPGSPLDAPWMILYTSGSSGRPKGALLTHAQLHWNALNTTLACDLRPGDATLTFAPLFHTGGMNCLSTPLLHRGGAVILTPQFDAAGALDLIARHRVTHLMGVPTIYQMMADHPAFAEADLSSVRDALCGGAALSVSLLLRYQERNIPLRQGFGLTEVGPNCFSTPPDAVLRKKGSVGLPIHHIEARLVRPDGVVCGPGEAGELVLRGPVVCGGYWEDPVATAKSIVDGWFHTGDLLETDEDGYFYVRGRIKEMFISGGENVYPAEVEAAIQDCPGVALAAVVGVPHALWGEVGHAFLQAQPGADVDADAVRAFLDGRLARYKIPKVYTLLPELPRTGSGKIDKQLLARGGAA